MKSENLFLVMILSLTTAIVMVSGEANIFLGDSSVMALQIQTLEKDVKASELRESLAQEQVFDYQQSVLKTLGQDTKPKNWAEMNLITGARSPASIEEMDRSGLLLSKAKDEFNSAKYSQAAQSFLTVTEKYPASPSALEARFLRAESLYLAGQMDVCVEQIDEMMTQFPDHPMTGFLMLRLSQILKSRSRAPEAREVLQMIHSSFPGEKALLEQARTLETEFKIL